MLINLDSQLSGQAFPFMMIFCRLGAGLMMFPGVGEAFVTPRIRMMFALALSLLMLPVLAPLMPKIPDHPAQLAGLVCIEVAVGLFFGSIMRLMMSVVEIAGAIIGMDIGLSNASILNPSLATESALPAAFLGVTALVLVFSTGLDEMLFRSLMDTYKVFPVGLALPVGEITQTFIETVSKCFAVGIQLASPFIVMGLLMYVAIGVLQRLMPQVQLFLIVMPLQIWGGFFVFSACVSVMLAVWLGVFDETVFALFVRPDKG